MFWKTPGENYCKMRIRKYEMLFEPRRSDWSTDDKEVKLRVVPYLLFNQYVVTVDNLNTIDR